MNCNERWRSSRGLFHRRARNIGSTVLSVDSLLKSTILFRIIVPLAVSGLMFAVARARKLSFREDIGVRWSSRKAWPIWLLGWGAWTFVEDFVGKSFGVGIPSDWSGRGPGLLVLLAIGMVVLAPFSEELAFRGLIFHQVNRRLGATAAIVLTAVMFALLHVQYGPVEVALILIHGLVLGLARSVSGSMLVTFVMHAMGNLYAYVERLPR